MNRLSDLHRRELEEMKKKLKHLEWVAGQTKAAARRAAPAFKRAAKDLAAESKRKFDVQAVKVWEFGKLTGVEPPND